jgi:Flp pilus assembly protein TadG
MKKGMKGSLTVEAALIMPLVIFMLFALMYITFYLHDRCRIQGAVDKALYKAMLTIKHEADISTGETDYENINTRGVFYQLFGDTKPDEDQILELINNELKGRLLLVKIKAATVTADKFNITVTTRAEAAVSLKGAGSFLTWLPEIKVQEKGEIHNPQELIRIAETVLDTGSKIKGVAAFLEKLEGFFK